MGKLDEIRPQAYENDKLFEERTKKWYDAHIIKKTFNIGDYVLLFNSRLHLFPSKLKSRWSGPFRVTQVHSHGTLELQNTKGETFKVNGYRCKIYHGGLIPNERESLELLPT